jgi:uncharacterized membrane protein YheB (UPF0754 family)
MHPFLNLYLNHPNLKQLTYLSSLRCFAFRSPKFLTGFMDDVKEHIDDIFDLKTMVIEHCVANKQLLNNVFMNCGDKEFVFIERSGFYFGFLFGLIQMGIYFAYTASWVLPAFGFLVGIATNWIALKIIFLPIEPKKLCFGQVRRMAAR